MALLFHRQSPSSYSTCIRTVLRFYSSKKPFPWDPYTAIEWKSAKTPERIPKSKGLPEVIVTGCPNTGKSSLLNAVVGRKNLLMTSKIAGRTRALNFYKVGKPEKVVLVDSPGYGVSGKVEWGNIFNEYIETREQLKRIYILFTAKKGLNEFDREMLAFLSKKLETPRRTQSFTIQTIITKSDQVPKPDLPKKISFIQKDIWEAAPLCLQPIVTSTLESKPFQIDRLRKDISDACGI